MCRYLDDETLTDNMDDKIATRLYRILATVKNQSPQELDHEIHVVRLLNKISTDPLNQDLVERVISRLEERYGQA
jgi:hypothetical protein